MRFRKYSSTGFGLLEVITASALTVFLVTLSISWFFRSNRKVSGIMENNQNRDTIRVTVGNVMTRAIPGVIYLNDTVLNAMSIGSSLGMTPVPLDSSGNPTPQGAIVSSPGRALSALNGFANASASYGIVAILTRDPSAASLSLASDTLVSTSDFSMAVSGDEGGYAAGDVVVLSTAAGAEIFQVTSVSSGALTLTSGYPTLPVTYFAGGTLINRVAVVGIGVDEDGGKYDKIRVVTIPVAGPPYLGQMTLSGSTITLFSVQKLATPSDWSSWSVVPSGFLVPGTSQSAIRIGSQDSTAFSESHVDNLYIML